MLDLWVLARFSFRNSTITELARSFGNKSSCRSHVALNPADSRYSRSPSSHFAITRVITEPEFSQSISRLILAQCGAQYFKTTRWFLSVQEKVRRRNTVRPHGQNSARACGTRRRAKFRSVPDWHCSWFNLSIRLWCSGYCCSSIVAEPDHTFADDRRAVERHSDPFVSFQVLRGGRQLP